MARVIVLGGGFGGIAAATRLRDRLAPADEVILVDRRRDFAMGLRKTWEIVGARPLVEGMRPLDSLRRLGIDVRQAAIEAVDPAARRVVVDGATLEADALVIGLGAESAPDTIPGLVEHGIDVWDRTNAARARDALQELAGGRLLVGVFGVPYACPPGPYELALLTRERLASRGVDATVEVFVPMPIALPAVGPVGSARIESLLDAVGITFHRGRRAVSVNEGTVRFAEGDDLAFDLLLAVPPHRCPPVLVEAGLAPAGGWVTVDPRTLATEFPGVYAVGDCTTIPLANGLALPKAGVFAEAEGTVVAERIAAELAGREPAASFEGEVTCYVEVGDGLATEFHGRFLDDPPAVVVAEPTADGLAAKVAFEVDRLSRWFGA